MDETLWQSRLQVLITNLSPRTGKAVFDQRKLGLGKNFVALMEENLPDDCLTDVELSEIIRVVDQSL